MISRNNNLIRDFGIIILSILIAVIFIKTGILKSILTSSQEMRFLGSFIAGMFFVFIFTAAPSMVVIGKLAQANSVLTVALAGGLGALLGDLIIFRFIKNRLLDDFLFLIGMSRSQRLSAILHFKFSRWLLAFIGALVVASPLPDELGLAMMGLSKLKMRFFVPISFLLNFLGILIIGLVAQAIK